MKLIIGAMVQEIEASIDFFNAEKLNYPFGELYQAKDLLFCVTGIGLVNAASHLTYVLTNFKIEQIINIGTAGSCDPSLQQNDLVLIDKIYCSTADATGFGYAYGQVPRMPAYYQTSQTLLKTKLTCKNLASADIFIDSPYKVEQFIKQIDAEISVLDMECFAYAQTAYLFKVPFVAVKVISDVIGKTQDNSWQFNEFIPIAGAQILKFLKKQI